jgi:hypothetical protein
MGVPKCLAYALTALLGAGLGGCQTGPGPVEQQANSLAAMCQQGDRKACAQWNALGGSVQAERSQQSQNNAVAAGLGGAAAGLVAGTVIGNATAGPRYYYGRGYNPYYRRGWW